MAGLSHLIALRASSIDAIVILEFTLPECCITAAQVLKEPSPLDAASPQSPTALPRKHLIFLAAFVLLLLPLCRLGYGSDNDTYGVLEAGRAVWQQHHLYTSRNPGYWTFEALTFALSQAGSQLGAAIGSRPAAISSPISARSSSAPSFSGASSFSPPA